MQTTMRSVLSNAQHPEYGQVNIPYPIPNVEYDHVIETLDRLEIGDVVGRDCQVDEIVGGLPILKQLERQAVNVDELDYLVKRLDSFDAQEQAQFQAMAFKLDISDMTDLINLTFCCQKATVITDFSDLEVIGRRHYLTVHGGCTSSEELRQLDACKVAEELLENHSNGQVTPYGVVYDNGLRLERIYDGQNFPEYSYGDALMTVEIAGEKQSGSAWLYLPMSTGQLDRALRRAGVQRCDTAYEIAENMLPPKTAVVAECSCGIQELNELCRAVSVLDAGDRRKLDAVIDMAQPEDAAQVTHLAKNLELFDFIPDVRTPEEYGRYMIQESGRFDYDENLDQFYDYEKYAQRRMEQESGMFTEQGYVAYHGTLTLDELMMDEPDAQGFGMKMEGI